MNGDLTVRMDTDLNESFYKKTTSWYWYDDEYDFELLFGCPKNTYIILLHAYWIIVAIGIVFTITTLLIIGCHRSLRKKYNIFPINIVLTDCLFNCASVSVNATIYGFLIGLPVGGMLT